MIVQIYTVQTTQEGLALAELGVDHIGITPSRCGLPGEIEPEAAAGIFRAIGSRAVKVALTVECTLPPIVEMVQTVAPDILQLCGDLTRLTPEQVVQLKQSIPGVRIMQAIPVTDRSAIGLARSFQEAADYLILDSYSAEVGGIGAAGFTHDWSIDRQIVSEVGIPVVLAGGLSPDNVAAAIQAVRPWGVDSLTHTNLPLGGGRFRKDLEKVRAFVEASRAAGMPPLRPAP